MAANAGQTQISGCKCCARMDGWASGSAPDWQAKVVAPTAGPPITATVPDPGVPIVGSAGAPVGSAGQAVAVAADIATPISGGTACPNAPLNAPVAPVIPSGLVPIGGNYQGGPVTGGIVAAVPPGTMPTPGPAAAPGVPTMAPAAR